MVGPPLAVAVLLGAFWRRFSARAAFWTIAAGIGAMALSVAWPDVLAPFSLGIAKAGGPGLAGHLKSYFFVRALYGFVVCGTIGIVVALVSKQTETKSLVGLVWGTLNEARANFKGEQPTAVDGKPALLSAMMLDEMVTRKGRPEIRMPSSAMERLHAQPGDLVYVTDPRWYLGGLRSAHAVLSDRTASTDRVELPKDVWDLVRPRRENGKVRIEKIM